MRILEKNLQNPHNIKRIKNLNFSLVITAGEMSIALSFKEGCVKLKRGKVKNPAASIEGSLESFLKFARGENPIWLIISRRIRIKISGNPFLLIKVIKVIELMRAKTTSAT